MRFEPQTLQSSSQELLLFAQGSNVIAWLLGRENQQLEGKRWLLGPWSGGWGENLCVRTPGSVLVLLAVLVHASQFK